MSTYGKRKGSKSELDVAKYLINKGFPYAERRLAGATLDKGDIAGVPGVCFEIKNHAKMNLAGWVEEMLLETANAKAHTGVVIHKRKGKSDVGQWYATQTVDQWIELLIKASK